MLRRFARDGSEEAFSELVRRHLNLVHSAALRQVRSPQLAEEVAQSVFTDLARDAARLKPGTVLAAWLYQVTRRTAIDVVRREARRQLREQVAVEMNAMNSTSSDWVQVEPLLDDAMAALDDTDRTAVLLRYFENKPLSEVGAALGTSDDTAQKRVSRAVDKLRDFFAQRGVTVGASGLILAVTANAVQAAPTGLALTISAAAALAGTTLVTSATVTTTQAIAMTTLQKTLVVTVLAVAGATGIYEAQQAADLRAQVHALQQQQAPLTEQIQQVERQRDQSASRFATAQREIEQLKLEAADIHRLRGEVSALRQQVANTPAVNETTIEAESRRWLTNLAKIKAKFEEMPDQKIPELQYLSDHQWLTNSRREPDELERFGDRAWRQLFANMRAESKMGFASQLGGALQRHVVANDGKLPTDLSQLKQHSGRKFGEQQTMPDEILNRYRLVQSGNLRELDFQSPLIIESAPPADAEWDTVFQLTATVYRYRGIGQMRPENENVHGRIGSGVFNDERSGITRFMKPKP